MGHFGDVPVTIFVTLPLTQVMLAFLLVAELGFLPPDEALELFLTGGIRSVTVGAENPKL